jgi:hypothetical protein
MRLLEVVRELTRGALFEKSRPPNPPAKAFDKVRERKPSRWSEGPSVAPRVSGLLDPTKLLFRVLLVIFVRGPNEKRN